MMSRVSTVQQHIQASMPKGGDKTFTKSDILQKREEGQVWIVIKGKVYDVTEFLDEHPGGAELITDIAADDFKTMTVEFDDAEHSEEAMEQLQELYKGLLVTEGDASPAGSVEEEDEEEEDEVEIDSVHQVGDPNATYASKADVPLLLDSVEHLSHDVSVYRFSLPQATNVFSLPIGKHVVLAYEEMDGKHISRAYTPVSPFGDTGFLDLLIKHYPTGKMSQHLRSLKPGSSVIQTKGPKGKLQYMGQGLFKIRRKGKEEMIQLNHVGMCAGGSGITPMFQIIQQVANDPDDKLAITLIFANKSENDVILREPLEHFASQRPDQIKLVYTIDKPEHPDTWTGEIGFIDQSMLKTHMPSPHPNHMILLCGPPPMINMACMPNLKQLGYQPTSIFKF